MKWLTSISLIAILLFSSTGLQIGIHKCGGHIKDVALFKPAQPCAHASAASDQEELPPCHRHLFGDDDNGKGCCEDEYHEVDILDIEVIPEQSDWNVLTNDFQFIQTFILADAVIIPVHLSIAEYLNFKPPLIEGSLNVLFQVFRI